jgi:serine protease Do
MSAVVHQRCVLGWLALNLVVSAGAQTLRSKPPVDTLQGLNSSLEHVTTKIAPAVVHIEVASYATSGDEDDEGRVQTLSKERVSGSGAIVDPRGYIVTARHVVEGARRIRVELNPRSHPQPAGADGEEARPKCSYEARVIGSFKHADLAILKIDAQDLPTLSFSDSDNLQQGQLVVALGSPEGLRNSLSLGVVSSPAQQIESDDFMVYIQTDTAMAPGSSGGPLVDVDGNMVGVNVFSITERGRDVGLGFAVPSAMVRFVYERIRKYGRVTGGSLGVSVQGINPTLASALGLPVDSGVIVAGIASGSGTQKTALQAGDVLLSFDGTPLRNVPQLNWGLLHKRPNDLVDFVVWRKSGKIFLRLPLFEAPLDVENSVQDIDVDQNLVAKLGIVGAVRNGGARSPSPGESRSAVVVAARLRGTDSQAELEVEDVIRSVNTVPINSVAELRAIIDTVRAGDAVALQVERKGKLLYVAFEMD